jgi:hypothetical protein
VNSTQAPEDSAQAPPVIPVPGLETARTVGLGVFWLTGLLLLGWPIAAFVAIFVFDAPIRSAADGMMRWSMAGAVWSYPVFWGLGFGLHRSALKRRQAGRPLYWPMLLPFAPILWLTIAFALG